MKLVIAITVLIAELGLLCWYGGYVSGQRGASRVALAAQATRASAYQAYQERERAAGEVQRQRIVAVDSVRFVNPRLPDDPWAMVEFKLTNRSGKAINELDGSMRLYDSSHKLLGTVGANVVEPLTIGGSATGRTRWDTLDPATRSALVDGSAIADYRADRVFYADGAIQRFTIGELMPDSAFFPAR